MFSPHTPDPSNTGFLSKVHECRAESLRVWTEEWGGAELEGQVSKESAEALLVPESFGFWEV